MKITFSSMLSTFVVHAPEGTLVSLSATPTEIGDGVYAVGDSGMVLVDEEYQTDTIYLSTEGEDYTVEAGERICYPAEDIVVWGGNAPDRNPFKVGGKGGGGSGVGIDDYTTTERKIGKWIDGSDLYQRTFEATSAIHNDAQYYDNILGTSDSGINIVDFEGFVEFTGTDIVQRFSLHQSFGGSDLIMFFVSNSDLTSHIKFATNFTLSRAVITIKYTKPSVQANTLNANTQQTEEPTDEMR